MKKVKFASAVLFGKDFSTRQMSVCYPPPPVLRLPVVRLSAGWFVQVPDAMMTKANFETRDFRLDRTSVRRMGDTFEFAYWEY